MGIIILTYLKGQFWGVTNAFDKAFWDPSAEEFSRVPNIFIVAVPTMNICARCYHLIDMVLSEGLNKSIGLVVNN